EIEYLTLQYWATSASVFSVLLFLAFTLRHSHWGVKFSLSFVFLQAVLCVAALLTTSQIGLHPALKLSWVFFHGLASVKLIQHFMRTFPSCASIGEAFLVTAGIVLYFGDMLLLTVKKLCGLLVSSELVTADEIKRSEINIIIQGLVLGLLLYPVALKYILQIWECSYRSLIGILFSVLRFYNISKNSKIERILLRKYYHVIAVLMFLPALMFQVWRIWPFGQPINQFMNAFTDHRDSDLLIVSHFSLLLGCALPSWMSSGYNDRPLAPFAGILSLGIGDTMASMVGHKYGVLRWSKTGKKTIEGTAAGITSVLAACSLLLPLLASTGYISTQELDIFVRYYRDDFMPHFNLWYIPSLEGRERNVKSKAKVYCQLYIPSPKHTLVLSISSRDCTALSQDQVALNSNN
ncbi:dolichol kinase, partial [Trifolium pratense]